MPKRNLLVKFGQHNVIGGVNEREVAEELPPQSYSHVSGVFPEFAGLQSRMWGKRTLAKYASSIYGIYQFWTPLGYGRGLYQFTDTLDSGRWLTPTSRIVPLNLPEIPIDPGGLTVNEFGYSWNNDFGFSGNTCFPLFSASGARHAGCANPPAPAAAPNDANGGPGGQGKTCHYEPAPILSGPGFVNIINGYWIGTDSGTVPDEVGLCSSTPNPAPLIATSIKPAVYTPGHGGLPGNTLPAYFDENSSKTNLTGGNCRVSGGWNSYNQKGTLDLTVTLGPGGEPPPIVVLEFSRNGNAPFEFFSVPVTDVTWGPGGNYTAYPVDPYDYLNFGVTPEPNGLNGITKADFVNCIGITYELPKRICA